MIYNGYLLLINIIHVFTLQIYTFLRIVAHILVKKITLTRVFLCQKAPNAKADAA